MGVMYIISKMNYSCEFSLAASVSLFNKCILPILVYGAEIWGANTHHCIENVLHVFCRKQLGLGSRTPMPVLLGECGLFPLYIDCIMKVVKYWIKIISLEGNSLLKSCYSMMYRSAVNGGTN